jgi:hypothetical protein
MYFLHFFPSKIRISPTLSPPCLLPGAASPMADVVMPPHRVTLPSHGAKTISSPPLHLPTTLRPVVSYLEPTKTLNPHHRRQPPSLDNPTPTLHCYKKVISTLVTLPATQSRLHFPSSLARAPRYRSFTHFRRSLSPLSHGYRPSAQRHPR